MHVEHTLGRKKTCIFCFIWTMLNVGPVLELETIVYETWNLFNLVLALLIFEKIDIWTFPPA